MRREIADVLETVKRAKDRDKGCTLLIGAGCSVKAGIPMASEFVEIIRKEYPRAYERAPEKTYPHVMAELLMAERRDLISHYIDNAKINWAHLAIAQLMKHRFVDRVLTVNFDPLIMRACALVGVFPAVYDFAASQVFKPDFIAQQSIFHLHGQHTGLVVLNTESEVDRLSQHLGPLFTDSVRHRVWIVAGYSGENDPVFEHLAKTERYDNGLYWICYKDNPPKNHVQERILVSGKDCFCVQGFDADDFFVKLAQGLGCFPPTFVQTPFTHLENILQPVLPYSLPGNDASLEAIPKKLLQDAIEKIEKPGALALKARDLLLMGNFNAVIEMETELANTPTEELAYLVAWGHLYAGNEFLSEVDSTSGEDADRLLVLAADKYTAALKLYSDFPEALNNMALVLDSQARKNGEDADRLWELAAEKYDAALKIKPDYHEALFNWADMLDKQAQTKSEEEADRLWALASEKFEASLKINPDDHEVLLNWALSLDNQARTKTGREADRLWELSGKKSAAALKIKRDLHDALNNWGLALDHQACTKNGAEADRLWSLAGEKYAAALKIKPDRYETLFNWGLALDNQAGTKDGEERDQLWASACDKYEAGLKINADDPDVLMNWANILDLQARTKDGEEADRLWALAEEKYEAALKIKPDKSETLYNWGGALAVQARTKDGKEADRLWGLAGKKLEAALKIKPNDLDTLIGWGSILDDQARTKSGKEADGLWALAVEKYQAVLNVEPEDHRALYNWGLALTAQAETKSEKEARQLLKLANEKLAAAQALAPELYQVEDENPEVKPKKRSNVRRRKRKKS